MRTALVVVALLVAGATAPAHAQWERGSSLLTLGLGYAGATSRVTGDAVNGGNIAVSIEHVVGDQSWSFGVLFNWISAEDKATTESTQRDAQVYSTPIFFTSRFWFGSPRVKGYGGLGVGWHQSSFESTIDGNYNKDTSTGFAMTVPFGVNWFVGDTVYLHASVQAIFMANAMVADDAAGVANLGVGFRL